MRQNARAVLFFAVLRWDFALNGYIDYAGSRIIYR